MAMPVPAFDRHAPAAPGAGRDDPSDPPVAEPSPFDRLLDQYGALVTWAVARTAGVSGREEVDDIRQDVLTALWRQLAHGRTLTHPAAYVYRTAVRETVRTLSLDRRRAVQAHLAGFSTAELMDLYGWSYQRARNLVARGLADVRRGLARR